MTKNLMPEVAALLGVEIGEEFIIQNADRKETVVLALDGFHVIQPNDVLGPDHGKLLSKVLQGLYEAKEKPWEPKVGDKYYAIAYTDNRKPYISLYIWRGFVVDYTLWKLEMIYRTEEEARAHMEEDYERLTGKPLSKEVEVLNYGKI